MRKSFVELTRMLVSETESLECNSDVIKKILPELKQRIADAIDVNLLLITLLTDEHGISKRAWEIILPIVPGDIRSWVQTTGDRVHLNKGYFETPDLAA